MDAIARALLGRVSVRMTDGDSCRLEVRLDGWPLLLVDVDDPAVRVNDLRTSCLFAHRATLPCCPRRLAVRTGAVADELYVLLSDIAAVFVVPDTADKTRAEVRVVDASTGRLLLDRLVRYRQLAETSAVPSAPHNPE